MYLDGGGLVLAIGSLESPVWEQDAAAGIYGGALQFVRCPPHIRVASFDHQIR
jgi:hypothetical protein